MSDEHGLAESEVLFLGFRALSFWSTPCCFNFGEKIQNRVRIMVLQDAGFIAGGFNFGRFLLAPFR